MSKSSDWCYTIDVIAGEVVQGGCCDPQQAVTTRWTGPKISGTGGGRCAPSRGELSVVEYRTLTPAQIVLESRARNLTLLLERTVAIVRPHIFLNRYRLKTSIYSASFPDP